MRNVLVFKFFSMLMFGLILIISGCNFAIGHHYGTIKKMKEIQPHNSELLPEKGQALILFVRPPDGLSSEQASVFEVSGSNPILVGILAAGTRVAYQVDPGKHIFMSAGYGMVSELMSADLLPDKTCYAVVSVWGSGFPAGSRYYLNPVRPSDPKSGNPQTLLSNSRLVEKTSESEEWARDTMPNILKRLASYEEELQNKKDLKVHLQENDSW